MGKITIGGKDITKPFEYQGKKVVQVDYNGHTLKFGPQLEDSWVPADGPSKHFGTTTFYSVAMGQHNGWPTRWDAYRVINGGITTGFMNLGGGGATGNEAHYEIFKNWNNDSERFIRVYFVEAGDVVRNGDMKKPWLTTYPTDSKETIVDYKKENGRVYWRYGWETTWKETTVSHTVEVGRHYFNVPWGTKLLNASTNMMFKFAGGTNNGSLFAINKVEVYKDTSSTTK